MDELIATIIYYKMQTFQSFAFHKQAWKISSHIFINCLAFDRMRGSKDRNVYRGIAMGCWTYICHVLRHIARAHPPRRSRHDPHHHNLITPLPKTDSAVFRVQTKRALANPVSKKRNPHCDELYWQLFDVVEIGMRVSELISTTIVTSFSRQTFEAMSNMASTSASAIR